MMHTTIEAGQAMAGDRFYDVHFYGPDKWRPIREVGDFGGPGNYCFLDLGYCFLVRHKREAVAIKREKATRHA